jgi:PAS domain S-box-containing protein
MEKLEEERVLLERLKILEKENERLKAEIKKFHSAVEYSPATIVITDLNGKIEYSNPGFTEITGYSVEEAMGENPRILKSGYHDREFYTQLWNTISSGEVWSGEFYNRKKNGEFYWEMAHIGPVKDDDGKITNYVAIKYDVTKKIESEQYIKSITSAIPELIFVMNEEGRFIDVFIADEMMLQYVKKKYMGKLVQEALPSPLAEKLMELISQTITSKSKGVIEYEFETNLGMTWFQGRSAPMDIKLNDKKCIILAAYDITSRKENEQKLLELNATKDRFFTIMAHDLRNPFGAILGSSELLSETLSRSANHDAYHLAKHITKSAELTFDLLENLLQWARSQTGGLNFKPQKIILCELVESTINLLENQAFGKEVNLLQSVPKTIIVHADLNLVRTILRNLVSNAIKYTPQGGNVNVSAIESGDFIQITVSDNGVGIPPEVLDRLFRIDSKYTTSGTNNEKGTGLGLILCKEFVELNGGKIWVESTVNKGSQFSFTLPRRKVN